VKKRLQQEWRLAQTETKQKNDRWQSCRNQPTTAESGQVKKKKEKREVHITQQGTGGGKGKEQAKRGVRKRKTLTTRTGWERRPTIEVKKKGTGGGSGPVPSIKGGGSQKQRDPKEGTQKTGERLERVVRKSPKGGALHCKGGGLDSYEGGRMRGITFEGGGWSYTPQQGL